ncbi:MAG: cyclic nucleotide-binding domain-containing protein [Bacteriovoracaceae bacterium]|nr:cyclic nucleotide-binding domain-containing protein [Bacteriovoracaceae bacterium]
MQFHSYGSTDPGKKRDHNEDNFYINEEVGLHILCDGMGGHQAGEVASAMAIKGVSEIVTENKDIIERYESDPSLDNRDKVFNLLRNSIIKTSRNIFNDAKANPDRTGMGTTLDLVLMTQNNAILAHVGDSRIFLKREDIVHQMSEDHSVYYHLVKQGVSKEEAKKHPQAQALIQGVGSQEYVEVDVLHIELLPNDTFLMCSDGLSDYTDEQKINQLMNDNDLQEVPKKCIEFANDAGGKDNITTIVVQATTESEQKKLKNIDAKVKALQSMPLFAELEYNELIKVLNNMVYKTYQDQDVIIQEGDQGEELFIIVTGNVDITKQGCHIGSFSNGDYIGEMSLIDGEPRSASVISKGVSNLLSISKDKFSAMLQVESHVAIKLMWCFLKRLNSTLRKTDDEVVKVKAELEKLKK